MTTTSLSFPRIWDNHPRPLPDFYPTRHSPGSLWWLSLSSPSRLPDTGTRTTSRDEAGGRRYSGRRPKGGQPPTGVGDTEPLSGPSTLSSKTRTRTHWTTDTDCNVRPRSDETPTTSPLPTRPPSPWDVSFHSRDVYGAVSTLPTESRSDVRQWTRVPFILRVQRRQCRPGRPLSSGSLRSTSCRLSTK